MKYWSTYLPFEYIGDVKRAILEKVQELGKQIIETSKPGHENESTNWSKYVALRDVYLCLEGAEKNEETVSLTTFKPSDDRILIMHSEAKFEFPKNNNEDN